MEPRLDQVGTELLFENERIRVWDFVLPAGMETEFHQHENDYVFVFVNQGNLDITTPDRVIEQRSPDGFTAYWETGPEPPPHYYHKVRNVGPDTHRQILIEFLGKSAGDEPRGPISNGR